MRIGVGYDFVADAREVCAADLGCAPEDLAVVDCWDFPTLWGYEMDAFWRLIYKGVDDGRVWSFRPPTEGFVETLAELRDLGHTVHICTSRGGAEIATHGWLNRFRVPSDSVTISKDKTVVDVDAFIEDYEGNYKALTGIGVSCALLDQPWNRHVATVPEDRIMNLSQFVDYVADLAAMGVGQ